MPKNLLSAACVFSTLGLLSAGCDSGFVSGSSSSSKTVSASEGLLIGNGVNPDTGLPSNLKLGVAAPGKLTSVEYRNSVRDLLALPQSFVDTLVLPEDSFTDTQFDNQTSAQGIAGGDMDKYLEASMATAKKAIASSYAQSAICAAGEKELDCVNRAVEFLAAKAFRTEAGDAEVVNLKKLAQAASGGYAEKMHRAIRLLLLSPNFLLKYTNTSPQLNGYQLAERLALFLWKSLPDMELLAKAKDQSLLQDEVLKAQVARMMADPRSQTLDTDFSRQWLGIEAVEVNAAKYPGLSANLGQDMLTETQLMFKALRNKELSLLELFTAKYSHLNKSLADFYGMPGPSGNEFVRVQFPGDSTRVGILAQAAVLAANGGQGGDSSPTHRGIWLLRRILCLPMGEPPDDAPPLNEEITGLTIRDRLSSHVTSQSCAGCHSRMDPIGYPQEEYDSIGMFREKYKNGAKPDLTGTLPSGVAVNDSQELFKKIAEEPTMRACIVQKYAQYGLGREVSSSEKKLIQGLAEKVVNQNGKLEDLVYEIVKSNMFRYN